MGLRCARRCGAGRGRWAGRGQERSRAPARLGAAAASCCATWICFGTRCAHEVLKLWLSIAPDVHGEANDAAMQHECIHPDMNTASPCTVCTEKQLAGLQPALLQRVGCMRC